LAKKPIDIEFPDQDMLVAESYGSPSKKPDHFNVRSIDEALSIIKEADGLAKVIGGGTDIIRMLKSRVIEPSILINLKKIKELRYIKETDKGLLIGALTTLKDLLLSPVIRKRYPIIAEAAYMVASPQIRNMGTVAGNLCQEVQCWYYRRSPALGKSFHCWRKGGKTCYAIKGESAYHAILGGNKCFASLPSDLAPVLAALDAVVKIASPKGEKSIEIVNLYTSLGITLTQDEIIKAIYVPLPKPNTRQRFLKFRERKTIDFAISSVAAVLTNANGSINSARVVLGGVSPVPYRATEVEDMLTGQKITEHLANQAAKAAVSKAKPLKDNAHKITITEVLVKRALL
jgi:xanthine dehydrogenase YagS FAD-binding subunit